MSIKEGLLSCAIPGQKQALLGFIVETERKHAVQSGETIDTPDTVGGQNDLCITRRLEPMAGLLQLTTNFPIVVNLPVEDNAEIALFIHHRLMTARREVDDRESPMGQGNAPIRRLPYPGIIWPAMCQGVPH